MPRQTPLDRLVKLLHPATYPQSQCARALAQADNDVAKAAELLLTGAVGVRSLQDWVKPAATPEVVCIDDSDEDLDPGPQRARKKCKIDPMQPKDFMARLTRHQDPTPTRRAPEKAIYLNTRIPDDGSLVSHSALPTITLHKSPLPHPLASALYLELMREAESFERHEWFLAGRKVASPHTSGYYHDEVLEREDARGQEEDGGGYWYAGKKVQPAPRYPPRLQQAANLITPFINDILSRRNRQSTEYAGEWRASYAAVNHYQGAGSSVGWHADQLTYLGPCTTIVSLSLGTPREFRLRPVPDPSALSPSPSTYDAFGNPLRTYALTLGHNSICIMHAGTQELYKHTAPPVTNGSVDIFKPPYDDDMRRLEPEERKGYTSRINVTFRFYRPDFRPYPGPVLGEASGGRRQGTPVCRCGVQCILRADQKGKIRAANAAAGLSSADKSISTSSKTAAAASGNVKTVESALGGMIYFWQCQSSSITGSEKGCGFFRVLDWRAEGRGPCIGDVKSPTKT